MANPDSPSKPAWALQPPYAPPSSSTKPVLKASCHCQAVKYTLSSPKPLSSKFCHCTDCQTIHGAPFQWAAIFHKDAVAFPDLNPQDLKFYNSSGRGEQEDGKPPLPCKVGCRRCGSWLFDEGRNMLLLFPTAIEWPDEEARKKFDVQ